LEQYRGKIKKLDYENLKRQEDIKSIISDPGKKLTENDKSFLALQQVWMLSENFLGKGTPHS
jgi:hypothetical protein